MFQQPVRHDFRVTISAAALRYNVQQLRAKCKPGTKFCAVVKANAYGHGLTNVIDILNTHADFFAVISADEARIVAAHLNGRPLLILEPLTPQTDPDMIRFCAQRGIHYTVLSADAVNHASRVLENSTLTLPVHLNLDTGMGRCGTTRSQADAVWHAVTHTPRITPAGLYTHFATADEAKLDFAYTQLARFNEFLAKIPGDLRSKLIVHAANSAATVRLPQAHFDMVRCGIATYGYSATAADRLPIDLKPALKFEAPIVHLLHLAPGDSASYSQTFIAKRPTLAAVLPVGYADGYWRSFSNRTSVKINGCIAPVIGRVTMNLIVVDVTDVPDPAVGQWAAVIDDDYDSPCGVYALARAADTITYEILTHVPCYASYKIID